MPDFAPAPYMLAMTGGGRADRPRRLAAPGAEAAATVPSVHLHCPASPADMLSGDHRAVHRICDDHRLMGAGLKIERLFRLGRWAVTCGCWPSPCGSASWPSRCWASGPGRSAARSLESRAQLNNAGSRRRPRDFQLLSNRPDMLRRERRLWAEQRRRPIGTTPELARQIREILARLETLPKVRRVEQGRWGLPINKAPPRVWR